MLNGLCLTTKSPPRHAWRAAIGLVLNGGYGVIVKVAVTDALLPIFAEMTAE
jgi:hypothetical protein